jgi:hypothetical protein
MIRKRLYPEALKPTLVDIAFVDVVIPLDAMQKGCSADPRNFPLREEEDDREVACRRRHGASRRVEDTPQKRDHRSSPEQMNSTPTNVLEAPSLPQTCAPKPWDRKICFAVSCVMSLLTVNSYIEFRL